MFYNMLGFKISRITLHMVQRELGREEEDVTKAS